MATIVPRKRRDGTTAFQAQISIAIPGRKTSHREVKTFDRKQAAAAWAERREKELMKTGAFDRARLNDVPLKDAIERYIEESVKAIGRTKAQVLRTIKASSFSEMLCSQIISADIVAYARTINAGPATRLNYLSHLATIFAVARPAWEYPLDQQAMKDAFVVCKRLGITSKSRARDRRPSLDELDRIMAHYVDRQKRRPSMAPMTKLVAFALFSTRRQEEIVRIRWADLDVDGSRVLVRDMKNPGEKIGNDVWCDLPPEALAIIRSMPKREKRIFPFTAEAISASFTRSTALLGIADLRFHDLRHEGVSRLFEMGATIPKAAAVSGHRNWQSMQRYTHMRQAGDKYEGWKWKPVVTHR